MSSEKENTRAEESNCSPFVSDELLDCALPKNAERLTEQQILDAIREIEIRAERLRNQEAQLWERWSELDDLLNSIWAKKL